MFHSFTHVQHSLNSFFFSKLVSTPTYPILILLLSSQTLEQEISKSNVFLSCLYSLINNSLILQILLLGTKISAGDTESNKTRPLLSKIIVSSGKERQVNHDFKNSVQRAMAGQRRRIRREAKGGREALMEKGSLIRIWKNEWEGAMGNGVKGRGNGVYKCRESSLVTASSTEWPERKPKVRGWNASERVREGQPCLQNARHPMGPKEDELNRQFCFRKGILS